MIRISFDSMPCSLLHFIRICSGPANRLIMLFMRSSPISVLSDGSMSSANASLDGMRRSIVCLTENFESEKWIVGI